ncbi:hypothetical protein WMY93_007626 [Mugilogobius chulae]|uniref:Claudin n=1 Tax=Mugilogobius chulae TaxID=88201 RepID=A0AAW0PDK6_9GOBI
MASMALELMGFFLGLLGTLGTMVATVLPYWQISAHIGPNIVTAVANMRGLWMECVYQSTGAFQCETYNSMLALPADLQASRALMVISIVLSVLAIAISSVGMQCTVCLDGAGTVKSRVAGTGGVSEVRAGRMPLRGISFGARYNARRRVAVRVLLRRSKRARQEEPPGVSVSRRGAAAGTMMTSQVFRNPPSQQGAANPSSRAQTLQALVRSASNSSRSSNHDAQRSKKNTGYDITGYV